MNEVESRRKELNKNYNIFSIFNNVQIAFFLAENKIKNIVLYKTGDTKYKKDGYVIKIMNELRSRWKKFNKNYNVSSICNKV